MNKGKGWLIAFRILEDLDNFQSEAPVVLILFSVEASWIPIVTIFDQITLQQLNLWSYRTFQVLCSFNFVYSINSNRKNEIPVFESDVVCSRNFLSQIT